MNIAHWLVILSAIVSTGGVLAYIRDTVAGKSKPNRVSWLMWALAPLIGATAAIYSHADIWATVRVFLASFSPLLVFIASFFNKQSYWKLTLFDLVCGVCAILALIIWGTINSTRLAILLAVVGDGFATLPTIFKAWKYPETETGMTYAASFVSTLLIVPSIPRWDIENSAFQIYLLVANMFLLIAVYRKYLRLYGKNF